MRIHEEQSIRRNFFAYRAKSSDWNHHTQLKFHFSAKRPELKWPLCSADSSSQVEVVLWSGGIIASIFYWVLNSLFVGFRQMMCWHHYGIILIHYLRYNIVIDMY